MNKAFKERQYVGRLSLASRRDANKAAMNEKRVMCEDVVESLYTMSCKDCNYGKSHCYCLAA
tara:strand:+ start:3086 stop:3271 length:186 start_codon:yes stop_codon:yes gene_type:complete